MSTFLFCFLIVFAWYAIGLISSILGNYLFLKRTKVTAQDLWNGIAGPVFFIAFIYCGIIAIFDFFNIKITKDTVLFDFGKKK